MQHADITPGRTVMPDGRSCLFFSGFSYLGLHQHPAFKAILAEGIDKYGTLFPSSRAGNLRLSIYEETEQALSVHLQQQAAAVFSSGYLASQAAVQYALGRGEPLYAPDTHPSLWQGAPVLPFSGSTPMAPANAHAWLQSRGLAGKMRRSLQQNIAYLLHLCANTPVHNPHHLPVFVLPPGDHLAAYLLERNIIISSFPYPHPHSLPVNRAVVSALHLQEDMAVLHENIDGLRITN
jgi:7-keto-8-aminopelargonate synthetase-like enzyme